jgi:DNA-binding response OmpR family regulator
LIVDDDKLTRWSVSGSSLAPVIGSGGCHASEGWWRSDDRPDAVLLDIVLPDGDGFSVLRAICEGPRLPVILITAHGSEETARMARDLGARGHLIKPCNPAELYATLALALDQPTSPDHPSQ